MAAGFFFSRASSRFSSNARSFTNQCRRANVSRSKLNQSLQRKVHTRQSSVVFITSRLHPAFLQPPLHQQTCAGSILNQVKACGLHVATCAGGGDEGTSGLVGGIAGSSEDSCIDPLLSQTLDATTNIFAVNDVPLTTLEGLGGYTPIGIVHNVLDFVHLTMGLPWWGALIGTTVAFRLLLFPLVIKGQANSAKLAAIKPEIEKLQANLRAASNYHDPMHKAKASNDLTALFEKHGCNPVKSIISPLVQLPLFISFFVAIRRMCYLPVESMQTGGLWWFTDLTLQDPYFVFPIFSALTMLLTIEVGAEAGISNPQMAVMKNVFRGMCFVMVPLTYTFPTAIFLYWVTSNAFSLVQVGFMKIPGIKQYFGIPDIVHPPVVQGAVKQAGFIENFKAGFRNAKEAAVLKDAEKRRKRIEAASHKNPYRATYDFNPRLKENEHLFEEAKKRSTQP